LQTSEVSATATPLNLNPDQSQAWTHLEAALAKGGFQPFLLYGVTGSGKTELYLRAIEEVIRQGKEAMVLVPEISLTPQTIQRFRGRCGEVAVLHSHLLPAERGAHWRRIASGQVQVVVGARSAVFAPTRNLGLRRATMAATWRSCAPGWRTCRSSSARRRPLSKAGTTLNGGNIAC
jgi:primosomal protein N' (replication factor Y)